MSALNTVKDVITSGSCLYLVACTCFSSVECVSLMVLAPSSSVLRRRAVRTDRRLPSPRRS